MKKHSREYELILSCKTAFKHTFFFNILDGMENFYLTWKSVQQFWKTLQTIRFFSVLKNRFQTYFNILDNLEKKLSDLEKFQEILEKFPHHMNLFFNEKELKKDVGLYSIHTVWMNQ